MATYCVALQRNVIRTRTHKPVQYFEQQAPIMQPARSEICDPSHNGQDFIVAADKAHDRGPSKRTVGYAGEADRAQRSQVG